MVRSRAIASQEVQPSSWAVGVQVVGSKNPIAQAKIPTPVIVANMASELLRKVC